MTRDKAVPELPEIARYTKYYEQDGMLRAYANRAMFLAILFGIVAFASLGFAIYVRVQPPTVIRVDKDGNAAAVGGLRRARTSALEMTLAAQAASGAITTVDTGTRDAGSSSCHAYLADAAGTRYRDVELGSDGGVADTRVVNAAPEAQQLLDWLRAIGVAL